MCVTYYHILAESLHHRKLNGGRRDSEILLEAFLPNTILKIRRI